jgi:hypothetical protein
MTCKKSYSCDLCRDEIREPTDGIGIRWNSGNHITKMVIWDSEHHLCNRCIEALRTMFADIDKTVATVVSLDTGETVA